MPKSVALRELIARKLLRPADVEGFIGLDVNISLNADESNPQLALMLARMPDGQGLVVLNDGSVQGAGPNIMRHITNN